MSNILTLIQNSEELSVLALILPAMFRVLLTIAVFLDCKAKNIAAKASYTIATFFFPVLAGIIYAVKRKTAQKAFKICKTCGKRVGAHTNTCPSCGGLFLAEYKPPKEKLLKTISIILCVIAVAGEAVYMVIDLPSQIDEVKEMISDNADYDGEVENEYDYDDDIELGSSELYYDRDGRAYSNESSVLYFSESEESYKYIAEENCFINTESGNKIQSDDSYVNGEGYFCIIKEGMTHLEDDPYTYTISAGTDGTQPVTVDVTFSDEEGNIYYRATEATWNYSGETLICGNTLK